MGKLNQILAVEEGAKKAGHASLTEAYQIMQKGELLSGMERTYQPLADDGEDLPSESQLVQLVVKDRIKAIQVDLEKYFDVTATKDWANTEASADVVVDGTVLLEKVPVTYLLFLEKRLVDMVTLASKLPQLDPAYQWTWDDTAGCYKSNSVQTTKGKKVPKVLVKYEATKEHPAQTELLHEDISVGVWTTTRFSGAVPRQTVLDMLDRVRRLQEAVRIAREAANMQDVQDKKIANTVLDFIFKEVITA